MFSCVLIAIVASSAAAETLKDPDAKESVYRVMADYDYGYMDHYNHSLYGRLYPGQYEDKAPMKQKYEDQSREQYIRGLRDMVYDADRLSPEQMSIVKFALGPAYYEPTWTIDYRWLKTGGRDYAISEGGKILILPEGIRNTEPKEFPNFDKLLEHTRKMLLNKPGSSHLRQLLNHREQDKPRHGHYHTSPWEQ